MHSRPHRTLGRCLDETSTWVVAGPSYLTKLVLADGATVRAPAGKILSMTVDGAATALAAGQSYTGAIILTIQ